MELNAGDVAALQYIIYRLRTEMSKPSPRRNMTINLCDRASLVLKKAERREKRMKKKLTQ